MALSDMVVSHLTTLYLLIIASIKVFGMVSGTSFTGCFVLILSTLVVAVLLIGTLTWDVSRKALPAMTTTRHHHVDEICHGGICWHGVAVRSPAAQFRFRLPQQHRLNPVLATDGHHY